MGLSLQLIMEKALTQCLFVFLLRYFCADVAAALSAMLSESLSAVLADMMVDVLLADNSALRGVIEFASDAASSATNVPSFDGTLPMSWSNMPPSLLWSSLLNFGV